MKIELGDEFKVLNPNADDNVSSKRDKKHCRGIIEIIIKDKHGNVVRRYEENIVKIFAKEMLAHRLGSSQIWDPLAGSGAGGWVDSDIDSSEEFSARYILLGASFDENGVPIENDPRYYTTDSATGSIVPIRLEPGADYEGSLINAIPLSEPDRPLKRVESISFSPTYQPAGTPLMQDDVRAMNNIVALQTTIPVGEYNGLGISDSDFFVLTEVALAGGKKLDAIGVCECTPRALFLEGPTDSGGTANVPLRCIANASDTISIHPDESVVDLVKAGDQIKIVGASDTQSEESIDQINPYYLVLSKAVGGRDITLDRVPVTAGNVPISGSIGIYRDTLRIFSHRILKTPVKKSSDFEIVIIWRIIFN